MVDGTLCESADKPDEPEVEVKEQEVDALEYEMPPPT